MNIQFWLYSLRGRVLALVVLAAIPGFVIAALGAYALMQQSESNARENLIQVMASTQSKLSDLIEDGVSDMQMISNTGDAARPGCAGSMRMVANQRADYLQLGMLDADGHELCTAKPAGGKPVAIDAELVRRVLSNPGQPVVSLVMTHPDTVPDALLVAATSSTAPAASIIFLLVALDDVFRDAQNPILRIDQLLVADRVGHISSFGGTSRIKPAAAIIGSIGQLEKTHPSLALAASRPHIERVGNDLLGWIHLGETGTLFILRIDRSALYYAPRHLLGRHLASLVLALLVLLGAVWLFGRRLILYPARALLQTADRLAQGDLDARTGLSPSIDELGRVATAFDCMAQDIQRRDAENRRQLHLLGRINRLHSMFTAINAAILSRTGPESLQVEICRIACEVGGFTLAWIGEVDNCASVLRPVIWFGARAEFLAELSLSLSESSPEGLGPASRAAREGVTAVINHYQGNPAVKAWHELSRVAGFRSSAAFPMGFTVDGRRRILALSAVEDDYFAAEEIQLIEQLAHEAAFGLHMLFTEQSLTHARTHDLVTGLPHEGLLVERLRDSLHLARAERKSVAVCVLEIDFAHIVSQWGSDPGNAMLRKIGDEVASLPGDQVVAGVLPGARFAIGIDLLDEFGTTGRAIEQMVERVRALRVHVQGDSFGVAPRVGIAVFPQDGEDPRDLLDKAQAVLAATRSGQQEAVRFFAPAISRALQESRQLEQQLQRAIERGELSLQYQPIVQLASGVRKGFEALLRWTHPAMGAVSPERFIPLAESSELIDAIGDWVVAEAASQALAWEKLGVTDIFISLNVSVVQLRNPQFAQRVAAVMANLGNPPKSIRLAMEITESQLMAEGSASIALLNNLRELGFSLILDDFGTGYSSLSYLHCLPIDVLKIDKSFIAAIDSNHQSQAVVKGIIALAQSLNLATVAEGIERAEQLEMVRRLGVTYAQGFLFDRACSAAVVEKKWL